MGHQLIEFPRRFIDSQPFLFLLPILLALVVNVPVLRNGFVWDDRALLNLPQVTEDRMTGSGTRLGEPEIGGPVLVWTLQAEAMVFGEGPMGYHIVSWLIHSLVTALVYLFLKRFSRSVFSDGRLPLLAASLFAIHPIHTEAVSWISGQGSLWMTLWLLSACCLYTYYLEGHRVIWMGSLVVITLTLAVLTSDTALGFIPIFLLFHVVLKNHRSVSVKTLRDPVLWISFGGSIVYGLLRSPITGALTGGTAWNWNRMAQTVEDILLTYGYYLRLMILPQPLNALVVELPSLGREYVSMIGLTVFFFAVLIWISVHHFASVPFIGLWWITLGLLIPVLEASWGGGVQPVIEKESYLSSIGWSLVVGHLFVKAWAWMEQNRGPIIRWARFLWIGIILLLVAVLSLQTVGRNQVWRDDVSLWRDVAQKSPKASRAQLELGIYYENQGNPHAAKSHYRQALSGLGRPETLASSAARLTYILVLEREWNEAERIIKTSLRRSPWHPELRYMAGYLYWEKALSLTPATGSRPWLDRAQYQLNQAISIDPSLASAYYLLGLVELRLNQRESARSRFQKVLQIDPHSRYGRFANQALIGLLH